MTKTTEVSPERNDESYRHRLAEIAAYLTDMSVRDLLREVFDYTDDGILVWLHPPKKRGKIAGCLVRGAAPYWKICANGRQYQRCHLVWVWHYGPVPEHMSIVHKNGDRLDDNIHNLVLRPPTNPERRRALQRVRMRRWRARRREQQAH